MGKKKKFIDKKNAATFQLFARDSSDPNFDETPGNDRVFVRVDNSAYSFNTFSDSNNDDSNSIFADAPDDEDGEYCVGQPSGTSGTTSLPEQTRREILELGFPDDGYNYLDHLREIKNTGGGSAFYQNPKFKLDQLPHDVKAYDASRVKVNEVKNDDSYERSIYSVASKSVGVKVQRAVDPEVVALLDDSDLSRFDSDVEDLEEDFIVRANCPEEGVDLDANEKFDLVEEDEVTREVVETEYFSFGNQVNVIGERKQVLEEAENGCASDKLRARRPLDDQFDLLEHQEYGTDSDDEYDGNIAEEEETLAEKLKHVLKDNVADGVELEEEYKVPEADVIRRCVEYAEKFENENEDEELVVVQESGDDLEEWDCETIVTTYSNLDNHPGKIGAPEIARKKKLAETISGALTASNHVIALRGKEKLPVDFLPHRKASTEKVKDVDGLKSAQPKRKQHGQESKEEKKERKAAVKEERREARQAKKEMKGLYRCEAQHAQKVAAISGPSSFHLM